MLALSKSTFFFLNMAVQLWGTSLSTHQPPPHFWPRKYMYLCHPPTCQT